MAAPLAVGHPHIKPDRERRIRGVGNMLGRRTVGQVCVPPAVLIAAGVLVFLTLFNVVVLLANLV
jgi:hypothetical protein